MSIASSLWPRPPLLPAAPCRGQVVMEADGVAVTYGSTPVLDEVSLSVRAGEVLALLGPNGAGKSTLLGVMAGDLDADRGTVTVDGAPMTAWSPNELAVRRAVLLQQVDVAFPFTVAEVVRMGRSPWAGTVAEDRDDEVVAAALADTDTASLAGRVYTSLSGGERARAALARVLAQESLALLLDEPTAALDIRHQELVLQLVRRRAVGGDAVVVVLHNLNLAAAYADTVALLSEGRLAGSGPPDEVLTAERLSHVYEHPIDVIRLDDRAPIIQPRRLTRSEP